MKIVVEHVRKMTYKVKIKCRRCGKEHYAEDCFRGVGPCCLLDKEIRLREKMIAARDTGEDKGYIRGKE